MSALQSGTDRQPHAGLHLAGLAERAHDLIYRYRLRPTRGFDYVNPAATRITGYTPADHYADPDLGLKLIHPDDQPVLAALLDASPGPSTLPLRWIRKDGTTVWTEQRNTPVYDEAGELVAIEGIAREIDDPTRRPGETIRLFPGPAHQPLAAARLRRRQARPPDPVGVQAPRTPHLSARRGVRPRGDHAPPLAEPAHGQPPQLRDARLDAPAEARARPAVPGADPNGARARLRVRRRRGTHKAILSRAAFIPGPVSGRNPLNYREPARTIPHS